MNTEIITILTTSLVVLLTLVILLKLNRKNLMAIKDSGKNSKLNEITNKLPENERICKEILSMLNNEKVNVKNGNDSSQASLYVVASNSILVANIKDSFIRVQTVAHECLHSIQDKRLLWFNFVFSNIYLLYFVAITILTFFNKIAVPSIFAIILVMMSILLFFVRSYLETDAMTKARFMAKEYMQTKTDMVSKAEIDLVVEEYDKLNSNGIKFYNLMLLAKYLEKVIIYCVVAII